MVKNSDTSPVPWPIDLCSYSVGIIKRNIAFCTVLIMIYLETTLNVCFDSTESHSCGAAGRQANDTFCGPPN